MINITHDEVSKLLLHMYNEDYCIIALSLAIQWHSLGYLELEVTIDG